MPMKPKPLRGYSLLELLMTMTLASTVLMLGVPSFVDLLADQRLRAESDALFHAVHLARKSSIVRRRVITICPSLDRKTCSEARDWSAGWIMFEERGSVGAGVRDPGETLLRFHESDPAIRLLANRKSFSFRSTHLRATNGTVRLCAAGAAGRSRAVVISYTGRPRVAYRDRRGNAYSCAGS